MRAFSIEEKLQKKLKKLFKKDKETYLAIWEKINEIVNCSDVTHYKNLRAPLQDFKRVHVRSSFVLLFSYLVSEDKVVFYEFDHHDNVYG